MMAATVATSVLLAAGFDWLEALLPVAFVLFWIISQVINVIRRVQGGNGNGNGRRPQSLPRIEPARAPAPPPAEDEANWRGELERQIAEFLREAQGRPAERPQEKPAPRPTASGQRRGDAPAPGRGRDKARPPRPVMNKPAAASAGVATRAPGTAPTTPDTVARHVQDAFAHPLSHLESALVHDAPPMIGDPAAKPAAAAADDFVRMLRNPATIRQVILMREVLDRPLDRW